MTSNPPGLDCHADCSAQFPIGTQVTLNVTADNPSPFNTLGGSPTCPGPTMTINSPINCIVTFNPGPSVTSVNGSQLLLQRRNLNGTLSSNLPYAIAGIVWSPASTGTNTSPTDPHNADVRRAEFSKWAGVDIPLFSAMKANTVRLLLDPGFDGTLGFQGWKILDSLYANHIMVIMTVDDGINDLSRIIGAVNFYKNHPAILGISLGSEWNINLYFGKASTVLQAAQLTEQAAQQVKALDANHVVVASYGEIDINSAGQQLSDTQNYVTTICPTVDVWSLNVFRGDNFGLLFQQWQSISKKPMFLGEFGADAFHTSDPNTNPPTGQVNEQEQAAWDKSLWNDTFRNFSARDSSKAALGGTVFEWQDEWWKVPPPFVQDTGGFLSGAFPDGFANEEFFGVVDIFRTPRQLYSTLQTVFDPSYNAGPQQTTFRAISQGLVAPGIGLAEFDKNHTTLYQKLGEGGGGRGFNIAAIDPLTGDLLSFPATLVHFDTWATRLTGQDMSNMITFLNSLPGGSLVLLSVADEAGLNEFPQQGACSFLSFPWVQQALQTFQTLGSTQIGNYCYNDSWAMITIKGTGVALAEQLNSSGASTVQTVLTIP